MNKFYINLDKVLTSGNGVVKIRTDTIDSTTTTTTTTTTTAAPTTTTTTTAPTTTTTTTAAPQALTFSALETGCNPRWQVGNIPANTSALSLTTSGNFWLGGVYSVSGVFLFSINTNSSQNTPNFELNRRLQILHYGASLPAGSAPGASISGYFDTRVLQGSTEFSINHNFVANIAALDASNNVIGIINNTSWIKDDCDD
jgi:hypothetical protein